MSVTVSLTAVNRRTADTARRGALYMSPSTMEVLSLLDGDPVLIEGSDQSAAVAFADASVAPSNVALDSLLLSNIASSAGASVQVSKVPLGPVMDLTLELPDSLLVGEPDLVRALLADKAVHVGDKLTLIPLVPDETNAAARSRIHRFLGAAYAGYTLKVVSASSVGLITAQTEITLLKPPSTPESFVRSASGAVSDIFSSARAKIEARAAAANANALPRVSSSSSLEEIQKELDEAAARRAARSEPTSSTPVRSVPVETVKVSDLPTLEGQAKELQEWLDLGFNHRDLLKSLSTKPQMGVLLVGPKGSGKEALTRAVVEKVGRSIIAFSGSRLNALDPAAAIKEVTGLLVSSTSKVVLLTEADLVFKPKPSPLSTMLLSAFGTVLATGSTALVATTSNSALLDGDFRALLGHTITIAAPARPERLRILEHLVSGMPLSSDVSLPDVASRTPGFVASDLRMLCDSAALAAARRTRASGEEGSVQVLVEDFDYALKHVKASSTDGASLEAGSVRLDDVRGVDEIKQSLVESVLWPLSHPDSFTRLGIQAPRGVLLYGPPGCGKTYLVKALAGEGRANIFSVKGAELLSKWVGESESQVRDVFRRARESSPSIIFLDEIDALAPARGNDDNGVNDRVVASLLTELNGVEDLRNVVVIGATNRPDLVDPALLRPGRLGKLVFVPPPDQQARQEILEGVASAVPFEADVDWSEVASLAENFSAADCTALVQEAALAAMREDIDAVVVKREHLDKALSSVKPSLDPIAVEQLRFYSESR